MIVFGYLSDDGKSCFITNNPSHIKGLSKFNGAVIDCKDIDKRLYIEMMKSGEPFSIQSKIFEIIKNVKENEDEHRRD